MVFDEVYLKGYWLLMICHFVCILHINSSSMDTNFLLFDDVIDYISNISSNIGDNNNDIIKYGAMIRWYSVYVSLWKSWRIR